VIGISGEGPSRRPRSIKDCRVRGGGGGGRRKMMMTFHSDGLKGFSR
jgi:hypothetical protein